MKQVLGAISQRRLVWVCSLKPYATSPSGNASAASPWATHSTCWCSWKKEQGKLRNPFINVGVIAVADRLLSHGNGVGTLLELLSSLCFDSVHLDPEVAQSEADTGFRNHAVANFMKGFGKLDNSVAAVLDLYFHQCAIRMSCQQMARAATAATPTVQTIWSSPKARPAASTR